jgi:hypothetical protein
MNIVELHEKVRFWLDFVGSTRFESEDIDKGLNSAINLIQLEKYDKTKINHNSQAFEKTQSVRDELREFVVFIDKDTTPSITLTNNDDHVLVSDLPDNYRYMLYIEIFVGNQGYEVIPSSRNRKSIDKKNPFRKVSDNAFARCYFEEVPGGIKVYHPFDSAAPTNVKIDYLKEPEQVYFGNDFTDASATINTDAICTLTPSNIAGQALKIGDEFNTGSPVVYSYGSYVIGFVNPELNSALHEELAIRAAISCLLSTGYTEKINLLRAEIRSF